MFFPYKIRIYKLLILDQTFRKLDFLHTECIFKRLELQVSEHHVIENNIINKSFVTECD